MRGDDHVEAEKYLERVKKLDAMILNKQRDYERWVAVADGGGGDSAGERVQASRNLHRGSDAIGNYIDLEREISSLKQERQNIIRTIEQLPTEEYCVTYNLYVEDYSLKEIAYKRHKSYDWVKARKKRSLALVQSILEEQTSTESG